MFDYDKLNFSMRNDILDLLINGISNKINDVSDELEQVVEETGSSVSDYSKLKTNDGMILSVNVEVPEDKIEDFVKGTDGAIKNSFKYKNWSDMRIN